MNINEPEAQAGQNASIERVVIDIRHITASQLAQLGVSQLAYVKPVLMDGTPAYAIHSADGTPMAVAPELDLALAAIRQHEMIPVSLH
jgi:hypothetical protein